MEVGEGGGKEKDRKREFFIPQTSNLAETVWATNTPTFLSLSFPSYRMGVVTLPFLRFSKERNHLRGEPAKTHTCYMSATTWFCKWLTFQACGARAVHGVQSVGYMEFLCISQSTWIPPWESFLCFILPKLPLKMECVCDICNDLWWTC